CSTVTEACAPTRRRNGVCTTPWGVVKRPRRAPFASIIRTSKEKLTRRVYHRKIQAIMVNNRTNEYDAPNEIPRAFPIGAFFGSAIEKPTAIRIKAQIVKRSRLPKEMSCQ